MRHTMRPSRTATEPTRRYAVHDADLAALVGHIHQSRPDAWSFHDRKGAQLHAPTLHALRAEIRSRYAER